MKSILAEMEGCRRSLLREGYQPKYCSIPENRIWEFVESVAGIQLSDGSVTTELDTILAIQKKCLYWMGLKMMIGGDRVIVSASLKKFSVEANYYGDFPPYSIDKSK